jgi:hypothetical protein
VRPERWARLLEVLRPDPPPHPVRPGTLWEYAALLRRRGAAAAARAFPEVAAHLAAGCADCEADLADLLAFDDAEERSARHDPGAGGLRRLFAALLAPPRVPVTAGLRGAGGAPDDVPARTYQADELTLTLRLGPGSRRGTEAVKGLVVSRRGAAPIPPDGAARLVPLGRTEAGAAVHADRVDELGNFVLDDLAPGFYRLELRLGDRVIVVDDLQLGGQMDPPGG